MHVERDHPKKWERKVTGHVNTFEKLKHDKLE
jgi:hypothetical protein